MQIAPAHNNLLAQELDAKDSGRTLLLPVNDAVNRLAHAPQVLAGTHTHTHVHRGAHPAFLLLGYLVD